MHQQLIRLSQRHFNLLEICPRKWQYLYLEQLTTPINPEQHESITWGSQFHLVMQQRELGLPINSLLGENEQLQQTVSALVDALSDILQPQLSKWREAEHCRTLNFQNYLLVVIYDLLVVDSQQAQILDWKTYLQPQNPAKLQRDWQTRLYLYVLAETSEYEPEQISLTYWFVKLPNKPQSLTIRYNSTAHEQTKEDLTRLLNQLENWLGSYRQEGQDLPQIAENQGKCRHCNFAGRCQRNLELEETAKGENWLNSLAKIEEISL